MSVEKEPISEEFYEKDLGVTIRELFPKTPVRIVALAADVLYQIGSLFPEEEKHKKPFAFIGGSSAKRLMSPTEAPIHIPLYGRWLSWQIAEEVLEANPHWKKALNMNEADLDVMLPEEVDDEDLLSVFDRNFGQRIEQSEQNEDGNLIMRWQLDERTEVEAEKKDFKKAEENAGHEVNVWEVRFLLQSGGCREQVFKFDLAKMPQTDETRDEHEWDCRHSAFLSIKQTGVYVEMIKKGRHIIVRVDKLLKKGFIESQDRFLWISQARSFSQTLIGLQRMLATSLVYPMIGKAEKEPIRDEYYTASKTDIQRQINKDKKVGKSRLAEIIQGYIYLWIADPIFAFLRGTRLGIYQPVPFEEMIRGKEMEILLGLLEKIDDTNFDRTGRLQFMEKLLIGRCLDNYRLKLKSGYKDLLARGHLDPGKSGPMLLLEVLKSLDLVKRNAGLEKILELLTPC